MLNTRARCGFRVFASGPPLHDTPSPRLRLTRLLTQQAHDDHLPATVTNSVHGLALYGRFDDLIWIEVTESRGGRCGVLASWSADQARIPGARSSRARATGASIPIRSSTDSVSWSGRTNTSCASTGSTPTSTLDRPAGTPSAENLQVAPPTSGASCAAGSWPCVGPQATGHCSAGSGAKSKKSPVAGMWRSGWCFRPSTSAGRLTGRRRDQPSDQRNPGFPGALITGRATGGLSLRIRHSPFPMEAHRQQGWIPLVLPKGSAQSTWRDVTGTGTRRG